MWAVHKYNIAKEKGAIYNDVQKHEERCSTGLPEGLVASFQNRSVSDADHDLARTDHVLHFLLHPHTYVYKIGIAQSRYSYAAAVGLLKSILSVTLMLLANHTSQKALGRGLF